MARPSKVNVIAARVEREIRSGAREPGSYAPSVRFLMVHDQVASATALRVHKLLRARGLIEPTSMGRGAVVSAPETWVPIEEPVLL